MALNQFFRAGVGTVIYTPAGEIILFNRSDIPDVWQLQQGGMDAGEAPIETLWRELFEETGLTQAEVTLTHEYPDWLHYEYPADVRSRLRDPNTLGQMHRWYFLALNPDTSIDLAQAHDQEFTSWRTGTFAEVTDSAHAHNQLKQAVYLQLSHYFTTHVLPTLSKSVN